MPTRCASRYACGHQVEVGGYWCRECQEEAARSDLPGAAVALAMVPNLNPAYQPTLLNSSSVMARMQLARRTDLDRRIRRQLLRDSDGGVVFVAAASRENDPVDLYRLLAGADRDLLKVLAGNVAVPLRGLRLLCDHGDPEISSVARRTFLAAYEAARAS